MASLITAKTTQPVMVMPSNIPYADTNTALTTSAVPLADKGDALGCTEIVVQGSNGNGDFILVGTHKKQTIELEPGQAIVIPIDDISKIWVKANSGTQTVNWFARGTVA